MEIVVQVIIRGVVYAHPYLLQFHSEREWEVVGPLGWRGGIKRRMGGVWALVIRSIVKLRRWSETKRRKERREWGLLLALIGKCWLAQLSGKGKLRSEVVPRVRAFNVVSSHLSD